MIDMSEAMTLVDDCIERESRLSDWERSFVDSIADQLGRGRSLTVKQIETLEEVWERATAKG